MSKFKVGDRFVIKKYEDWPSRFYGHHGVIVGKNAFGNFECHSDNPIEDWDHGRIFTTPADTAEEAFEHEYIADSPLYKAMK